MIRLMIAIAAATFGFAAPAFAQDRVSFERDGIAYNYTTRQVGDVTVIEGSTAPGGPFRLEVRGSQVRGTMNSTRVAFDVPARKPAGQVASAR